MLRCHPMAIWFKNYTLEEVNRFSKGNLVEHLGIEITALGPDSISGRMTVDHRTRQPFGILHGGASAALAESLCSLGANLVIDPTKFNCVGLEINANHVRPVSDGFVIAHSKPLHLGKTTHVWTTEILNSDGKLVCTSRMTLAVISKQ